MITESVMLDGCPHCGDGIPKIVAWTQLDYPEETDFVGDWDEELKSALLEFGQMRIISCRPIEVEENATD